MNITGINDLQSILISRQIKFEDNIIGPGFYN